MKPRPNQKFSLPRPPRAKTPPEKPCPRCYGVMRITDQGYACPKHGVPEDTQ